MAYNVPQGMADRGKLENKHLNWLNSLKFTGEFGKSCVKVPTSSGNSGNTNVQNDRKIDQINILNFVD